MKDLEHNDKLLIEKYMLNQLTKDEQQLFQQKLKTEHTFAEAFKLQLDIQQTMKHIEIEEIREYLDELYAKSETNPASTEEKASSEKNTKIEQHNIRRLSPFLKYAAAVLLLLGAGLLYFFNDLTPKTTNQLIAEHYSTPDLSSTVRGEATNTTEAITAYNNRDFENVLSLTTQPTTNPQLLLARAISLLETDQPKQAIQTLNNLQTNTQIDDQATWYLAICYLKIKDKENAKTQLRMLTDGTIKSTEGWKNKAKQLLSQL